MAADTWQCSFWKKLMYWATANDCCVRLPILALPPHLPPLSPTCRLLATVPQEDLAQAQKVVDTIRGMDEEASEVELQERAASLDKLL